jgi:PTS system nitrogen regulatory IIA component
VKLQDLISIDDIHLGIGAEDVPGALEAVAGRLADRLGVAPERIVSALLERERLGSTSVGDSFAIPHCKMSGIKKIAVALARLEEGVDFNSPDRRPSRFLFVVLSPPDQPAAHLQVLSQIARILKRSDLRTELLEAPDEEAILAALRRTAEAEGL